MQSHKDSDSKRKTYPRKNPLKHSLNLVWNSMHARCYNPKCNGYALYGARYIGVCAEWHNFENFYNWAINNGYSKGKSIDRIDNDGDYSPENCRYATHKEQNRNKRNNKFISHNGLTMIVAEWSEMLGLNISTIFNRLARGKSVEKALSPPKFTRQK